MQLETEEIPGESKPRLPSILEDPAPSSPAANDGHQSDVAPEEVSSTAETPVEPTAQESPLEPALQMPNDAPVLLEEAREPLEGVATHSS